MIALKMDSIGRKPLVLLCMLVAAVSCTFTTVTSGENNWMFIVSLLVTKSTVAGAYTLIRSGRIIQCFIISPRLKPNVDLKLISGHVLM